MMVLTKPLGHFLPVLFPLNCIGSKIISKPSGQWSLILEASQVKIGRSYKICLHVCLNI